MSRSPFLSRQRFTPAVTATLAAALATLLAAAAARGRPAVLAPPVLLWLELAGASVVLTATARGARGTRRALFGALAAAALVGVLGHGWWTLALVTARGLRWQPRVAAYTGLAAQGVIAVGFVRALARDRHRDWMRPDRMTDALLLIAAAAILIVQIDAVPTPTVPGDGWIRTLALAWQTLAAGNMVLVVLLLVWRGEMLGPRVAAGLSLGTVALALGSSLFGRAVAIGAPRMPVMVPVLWAIATAALTLAAQPVRGRVAGGAVDESTESPAFASDAAHVRTASIVIAILIAAGSAVALGMHGARSEALGVAIGIFGALLALRAGHALWAQQRTTISLERTVTAEHALASALEQRVAQRTTELAEAQRVLQRMWALGQQTAHELTPERVLQRFIEAATDVLRADGGVVGLADGDRIQAAIAAGIGASLAGQLFPLAATAMGRAVRTGDSASTTELAGSADADLRAAGVARQAIVIPLVRRGERVGAVLLLLRTARPVADREIANVEAMADLLAVALANAELVETLRKAEWRFRTLFRAAPDPVLTVLESGRIVEANEAVRDVCGLHPVQVVGRRLDELLEPGDRDRFEDGLARAFAGAPLRSEVHVQHSGGVRIVSLAGRRLPEADPPVVLVIARDMTADREMRARLAETERLAAVGELVAGVAHEVNNPLSTISAFAQLLERDATITADQHESLRVIRAETVRASEVLRDLLTFARRSETEPEPLELNEVVERTMRLRAYEMASQGITAVEALAPDVPLVRGDGRQLQQVLLNLVTNAMQAMAAQDGGGGEIRIVTRAEGGRAVLEVSDSGPGISAEARPHIFEPFFTTKREGTGLGLSVSYGIVAAHGGTITIPRSSAAGTTFRVSLPAYRDDSIGASAEAAADSRTVIRRPGEDGGDTRGSASRRDDVSPLAGCRVLFVDDEDALRHGVESFGRVRNFAVVAVADGAAALAAAHREPFDVVVCDIRMPGMDGPALYEVLRREHPDLAARMLFVTGDLVSANTRSFLDGSGCPVLAKPFELDRLESAVAELVGAGVE